MRDHYHVLGLRIGATLDQVKRAYRSLAMRFHPDHGGSEERMKAVNAAYHAIIKAGNTVEEPRRREEPVHRPKRRYRHRASSFVKDEATLRDIRAAVEMMEEWNRRRRTA